MKTVKRSRLQPVNKAKQAQRRAQNSLSLLSILHRACYGSPLHKIICTSVNLTWRWMFELV